MAVDGIVGAEYLITQLGTPYSKRDCINAVVIDVIRSCKGGKKLYRTAGCTELWNSIDKSSKYRDVTRRMTLAEAKAEGLLIGDLPVIYDARTGVCEHIAYYMGGVGGYECLHSSATKGELCPTTLKNGYTHVLRHRYITGRLPSDYKMEQAAVEGSSNNNTYNEVKAMNTLYNAQVFTSGGTLNMRKEARKASGNVLCEIPFGTEVEVLDDSNEEWFCIRYNGSIGYASSKYLRRVENQHVSSEVVSQDASDRNWGFFIPCDSRDQADAIGSLFAYGYVIQHVGDD